MTLRIETGYIPGSIGRIADLSVCNMQIFGFGSAFEARVARDAAEFCERLSSPRAQLWRVMHEDCIMGTIAMDGEDLGDGLCHLRWFMLDQRIHGQGVGRQLLKSACDFADAGGFRETRLWTIRGLDAARVLYEHAGFALVREWEGDQWGSVVHERLYTRPREGAAKSTGS